MRVDISLVDTSLRIALVAVGAVNAVSAVGGGIGLLTPGSMGIPLSAIHGAGFDSFLVPALLLLVVIGGTQLAAASTAWRRSQLFPLWSAVAGFGMLVWIYVEVAAMDQVIALHTVFFVSGLLQLALAFAATGALATLIGSVRDRAGAKRPRRA